MEQHTFLLGMLGALTAAADLARHRHGVRGRADGATDANEA